MTAADLKDRLLKSATALGWQISVVPEFTQAHFRGRAGVSSAPLPSEAYGLRLDAYPTIVAPVVLGSVDDMQSSLRKLHSQMVIARSYMRPEEVINAHLMLCAINPLPGGDWRTVVDLAERDETVCRKIVWVPYHNGVDASYREFLARTFLATPWRSADERFNAPLDNNQGLAQRILVKHGLPREVADKWIDLAQRLKDDPETMVAELVAARDEAE